MKKPARRLTLATACLLPLSGLGAGAAVTGEFASATPAVEAVLADYWVPLSLDLGGDDVYFIGAPQGSRNLHGDRSHGVLGDLRLLRLPQDGGEPTPLLSEEQEWEYPPVALGELTGSVATQRIAYVSNVTTAEPGDPARIVVCDLRTGGLYVVDNGMRNLEPAFSPDGTKVAFFSAPPDIINLQEACEQGYALHVFDIETGQETVLTEPSHTFRDL